MKSGVSQKRVSFGLFFVVFLFQPQAWASPLTPGWDTFFSAYYESAYLNRAQTGAGLFVPKWGATNSRLGFEAYVTARMGVDSRTFLEQSDQIYNDNFLFLGAGVDQVTWLKGVRFSVQVGNSIDLNPKIHLGGFDLRTGWMSYHEMEWIPQSFRSEFYTEGFYVRRYRNALGSVHIRNFWPIVSTAHSEYQGVEVGPVLQGVLSGDTEGYDYNRFVEAQAGVRVQVHTPLSIALHLLAVEGRRLDPESPIGKYHDFRALITGYLEIK